MTLSPPRLATITAAVAAAALWWQRPCEPTLDCEPGQVRLDAQGVAHCGPGDRPTARQMITLHAPLDLNSASAEQLAAIPSLGEEAARALVEARTRLNGFSDWAQVDSVQGIGPARLALLQQHAQITLPDASR